MLKAICSIFFLLTSFDVALAQQESARATQASPSPLVTASATAERVRFLAPSTVVQMHLQVYSDAGQVLFTATSKGNFLDWTAQDGAGERLHTGAYLCVVTVKSLSGTLSQRIGEVSVEQQRIELRAIDRLQLTAAQQSEIGPVEEDSAISILKENEAEAATALAHNGAEGLITRGRGALSFRLGDVYSGKDREQMRLTEEGNLGIGITHPQARLDVDGLIRTTQGIVFPDGTIQSTAAIAGRADQTPDYRRPGRELPNSSNQKKSSGKDAKGGKGVSPEFVVNEDLTISGNIIFTSPSPQFTRDITMQNNNGGLRFFGAPSLTSSPAAAAIQFWGNNSPFPGQLYLDSGAHDNGALIFRTTGTGGTIAERMRVTATGNVGIGTTDPGFPLSVNGVINSTTGGFRFPDGTVQTTASVAGVSSPSNYVFAYSTDQTNGASFIPFTTWTVNGWTPPPPHGANFTCTHTGLYLIQYAVQGVGTLSSAVALLNDVEIAGSQAAAPTLVTKSFIANINTGDVLKFFSFTAIHSAGSGETKPTATLTITEIK